MLRQVTGRDAPGADGALRRAGVHARPRLSHRDVRGAGLRADAVQLRLDRRDRRIDPGGGQITRAEGVEEGTQGRRERLHDPVHTAPPITPSSDAVPPASVAAAEATVCAAPAAAEA
ncbi:hypothetical protein TTY48_08710 [Tsukamurella sp. TY48]|nr:hypothetical protein TTY48_08710 [Tsukamurella sp. TY48]